MKISKDTMRLLTNYASIENSIYCDEPGYLKTINNMKSVIAIAEIEEKFPEFGIYNFSGFIQVLSMFDDVDVTFKDLSATVKCGNKKAEYRLTPSELIPNKTKEASVYKKFKDFTGSFELNGKDLNNLCKAAKVMDCNILSIKLEDGKGTIELLNDQNSSNNTYSETFEGEGTTNIKLLVDNLNFIPDDFKVYIAEGKFVKFEAKNTKVFYIVSAFNG